MLCGTIGNRSDTHQLKEIRRPVAMKMRTRTWGSNVKFSAMYVSRASTVSDKMHMTMAAFMTIYVVIFNPPLIMP